MNQDPELEKKKLSDLIEELLEAQSERRDADRAEEEASREYQDQGGVSWGYAGQRYFDAQEKAEVRVAEIKRKIDLLTPANPTK